MFLKILTYSREDRVVIMSKRVPALYFSLIGISMTGRVILPIFSTF